MNILSTYNLNNLINNMNSLNNNINKSQIRLANGKKLLTDAPSNALRISRLSSQINLNNTIKQNIQDGMSYLQQKDATLTSLKSMNQRLLELSTQYNNETLNYDDKKSIEIEASSLMNEMYKVKSSSKFNGKEVFNYEEVINIQTSDNSTDCVTIKPSDICIIPNSDGTYKNYVKADDSNEIVPKNLTIQDMLKDVSVINGNITKPLNDASSYVGLTMNVLETRLNLQDRTTEISTKTLSNLEDVDVASEVLQISKNSLLANVSQSLFSQVLSFDKNAILGLLNS